MFKSKSILLAASLLLAGCANYTASTLSNLEPALVVSEQTSSAPLQVAAKTFNRADCKQYLDRDVISKGFQPVQLYIKNNSEKNYVFSLSRIDLPLANPQDVANRVHTSTIGRIVGYGVASMIIWPFVIPAIVDGIKSSEANEALDCDFSAKSARDQIIAPYSYVNTLLFVPVQSYQRPFTVTLIDQETKEPVALTVN